MSSWVIWFHKQPPVWAQHIDGWSFFPAPCCTVLCIAILESPQSSRKSRSGKLSSQAPLGLIWSDFILSFLFIFCASPQVLGSKCSQVLSQPLTLSFLRFLFLYHSGRVSLGLFFCYLKGFFLWYNMCSNISFPNAVQNIPENSPNLQKKERNKKNTWWGEGDRDEFYFIFS